MSNKIRVAISSDFFDAFTKVPHAQQGKVSKFITNFQKNPLSSGINYEKIQKAKDPNMRSVRIDQAYRGIVLKPEVGNVYILLWVDHHDAAYEWAENHKCQINPETGAIQVFEVDKEIGLEKEHVGTSLEIPGAFQELKDKELVKLGVPGELIPIVRKIKNEVDLDAIENRLPVEAYEGLFLYIAGSRYDEIINERELGEQVVDTNDFESALERDESKSRFVVVDNELELAKMLNAPLEKWRVFLHPSQRKLVQGDKNGPVRVLGGAGTGKTVVAMHRAKWLAEQKSNSIPKILFTTFTKNLAIDIESNMKTICDQDTMSKLEIVNLDRWVSNFLRKRRYDFQILYAQDASEFWQMALDLKPLDVDLPDSFYREEWLRIIQPNDVVSVEEYIKVSRVGRGTRLSRSDRIKIWPVFEEYRNLLNINKYKEVDDAYRDAAALIKHESQSMPYTSIVVDEAQDMSAQAFRLLRAIIPEGKNDLFIVGDGHQRIYGKHKVVLGQCGINIKGRSKKLRINYRTTEEIRSWAVRLLEGKDIDDLDGGHDTNDGYKSLTHGEYPRVEKFNTNLEQINFLVEYLYSHGEEAPNSTTCIVARTNSEVDYIEEKLKDRGIDAKKITSNSSEYGSDNAVRLATMHRVKGLEFDDVILASVNDGLVPLNMIIDKTEDPVERSQADTEERALLYVAITRAKKSAIIVSYGKPSIYLTK